MKSLVSNACFAVRDNFMSLLLKINLNLDEKTKISCI